MCRAVAIEWNLHVDHVVIDVGDAAGHEGVKCGRMKVDDDGIDRVPAEVVVLTVQELAQYSPEASYRDYPFRPPFRPRRDPSCPSSSSL